MKSLLLIIILLITTYSFSQSYTTSLDTFYVQTPEYSASINVDSLHFPTAITTPTTGSNFPILILVHGTAALDKDASSTKDYLDSIGASYRKAETQMFHEIADSLSRNGIMVFRYDKRSYTLNCIEKPQCWNVDTISPYDYIKDIHYAVNFAKQLPNVDTCNIFLAGHSQGGSFVSKVGYDRSDIRGVLNMAGTAQPIDSVVFYQEEFINSNPNGATILRQQFDSLRNGLWDMNTTLLNSDFSPRFWLDWLFHTDSAILVQKNSDKPTALMYGTSDRFVPSAIHYQIWLDSVTRPNATFQLFNDIDHGFGLETDSTMSPVVLNFMENWIHTTSVTCNTNSIEELEIDYLVYPNPTHDIITIKSNSNNTKSYELIDVNGRVVINGTINNKKQLNLSSLEKGIYFIKIDIYISKIIKQ